MLVAVKSLHPELKKGDEFHACVAVLIIELFWFNELQLISRAMVTDFVQPAPSAKHNHCNGCGFSSDLPQGSQVHCLLCDSTHSF